MNSLRTDELTAAWDWSLRLREETFTPEEFQEWCQWYRADERHRRAFEEMQTLWHEAGRLSLSSSKPRPRIKSLALAASVLLGLAVILGGYFFQQYRRDIAPGAIVRETQLPDGSKVELAARSRVNTIYTPEARTLDMQGMAGEAYFSVAKNPQRPFVVKVGDMRVRAIGTAFNIRRANDRVVVTVTEGIVEVYENQAGQSSGQGALKLGAGEQAAWNLQTRDKPQLRKATIARTLAWQEGRLEYLNEPLAAVIADINRYARQPVQVADAATANLLISGTVLTHDCESWIRALPEIFPVELYNVAVPDGRPILTIQYKKS